MTATGRHPRSTNGSSATRTSALLANGYGFVDALAGGPFAGWIGAPLFLSDSACVPYGTWDGILARQVSGVVLLGSEATLGPRVDGAFGLLT